ncbi:MAG: hypothetical protein DWI29_04335 [Planctomycetota bacterium]|nr:MAG: hypothetical protein DWI29_04335 [Planctomycetota bacterium]
MAQHEGDREDLMREAVALPDRVELSVDGFDALITIGFRANSAMSIFIGQDPVYQFDPEGRLRRAFVDGRLYRSQHTTLAMLKRERTDTQTLLLRTDLAEDALQSFRGTMLFSLQLLEQKLNAAAFSIRRSVPESVSHITRIQSALAGIRLAKSWLSPTIRRRI